MSINESSTSDINEIVKLEDETEDIDKHIRRTSKILKIHFLETYINSLGKGPFSLKNSQLSIDLNTFKEVTIGRAPDNIIVIPDPTVSRRHALLTILPNNEVLIKDLGSKNGTYVLSNGVFRKVSEYRFSKEIIVRLGFYTVIKFVLDKVSP
ncbi:MAG: FHA domain-containing protein [Thermoprotei archaeon ex4572_64]|nr:MAG: FHA domain-containing protein [Thermoprotei archaeon ex4572_64]